MVDYKHGALQVGLSTMVDSVLLENVTNLKPHDPEIRQRHSKTMFKELQNKVIRSAVGADTAEFLKPPVKT